MMLLELLGHQVRAVNDGLSALDAAHHAVPDVMLVDIGLPGMDGYELARRVRSDPALRGVTLVAITGYGFEEHKARALAAGFDDHVRKPINVGALQLLLSRLGQPQAQPTIQ